MVPNLLKCSLSLLMLLSSGGICRTSSLALGENWALLWKPCWLGMLKLGLSREKKTKKNPVRMTRTHNIVNHGLAKCLEAAFLFYLLVKPRFFGGQTTIMRTSWSFPWFRFHDDSHTVVGDLVWWGKNSDGSNLGAKCTAQKNINPEHNF